MEAFHNHEQHSQENEFEIGSAEGLHQFLEYVEEAHRAVTAAADNSIDSEKFTEGKALYEKIKNIIAENLAALKEGREVEDETIETLQSLYDEMWGIADDLRHVNDTELEDRAAANDNEALDLNETMDGSVIIEEAEGAPAIEPLQSSISEEEFASAREASQSLLARARTLIAHYESGAQNYPDTGSFNAMAYYFDELKASAFRAETIANTLARPGLKDSLDVLEFTHFEEGIQEITENIDQLEGGIEKLLNPPTEEPSSIEEEISSMSKPPTGTLPVGAEEREVQTIVIKRPEPVAAAPAPQTPPRAINARLETPPPRAEKRDLPTALGPFIQKALRDRRYATFIEQSFNSSSEFETALLRRINEIEAPSKFDKVFGFNYESAFHRFLKDRTIAEIDTLERLPNTKLRELLQEKNIEYEAYVRWLDAFYEMVQMFRVPTSTTFGELYVRAELEDLMRHYYAGM